MNMPSLIAKRYILRLGYKGSVSKVALISFISIALGTASLTLVTSIMNGFEVVTKQKIQNINPHLISSGTIKNLNKLLKHQAIEAAAPIATENILICSNNNEQASFSDYAILKGVDIKLEPLTTQLFSKFNNLIGPIDLLEKDYVLIGKELSNDKAIFPGDKISLCIPTTKNKKLNLKKIEVTVLGLIDTGINEYDSNLIISSMQTLRKLSNNYKEQIGLKIKDGYNLTAIQKDLKLSGYTFFSWQDLYPALFSALKLEKYATFIVLALILLIATINLIALIFMLITQKKRDIAILKAMGMPLKLIKKIFILFGSIIVVSASLVGLTIAFFAGIFIKNYAFIELPDVYYVSTLPIKMTPTIFLIIFSLTLFLGLLAILLALRELKNLNSAHTLKCEI